MWRRRNQLCIGNQGRGSFHSWTLRVSYIFFLILDELAWLLELYFSSLEFSSENESILWSIKCGPWFVVGTHYQSLRRRGLLKNLCNFFLTLKYLVMLLRKYLIWDRLMEPPLTVHFKLISESRATLRIVMCLGFFLRIVIMIISLN